jgi:hypothetical protein
LEPAGGGVQVARVKLSTALRTKKRGKVPPRLETLWGEERKKGVSWEGSWDEEEEMRDATHVARRVIYVPPMAGSEILAWKAEMATNMTVLMKVLKTCSTMMTRR